MSPKRKKSRPVGETIGGIIAGFDQQIFRSTPPAQELVKKGSPVRGLSGEDGGGLEILFPGDEPSDADASAGDPGEGEDGPAA